MNNTNIHHILFRSSGRIIDDLGKELSASNIKYKRGPMCFSSVTTEFLTIGLPLTTAVIGALSVILSGYLKKDEKAKVTFYENGQVQEIESVNCSKEKIEEIIAMGKVERIEIE